LCYHRIDHRHEHKSADSPAKSPDYPIPSNRFTDVSPASGSRGARGDSP
jgi:hypothetical protein